MSHISDTKASGLSFVLLTVSDTRTVETDKNGAYLKDKIITQGNIVEQYDILPDEPELISKYLESLKPKANMLIIINGGTGFSRRDNTFDAVRPFLEKEMTGFGELFRSLSYEQVGTKAMFSRACAGAFARHFLFSIPGSHNAVRLAWEKLIEPELAHLAHELTK